MLQQLQIAIIDFQLFIVIKCMARSLRYGIFHSMYGYRRKPIGQSSTIKCHYVKYIHQVLYYHICPSNTILLKSQKLGHFEVLQLRQLNCLTNEHPNKLQ